MRYFSALVTAVCLACWSTGAGHAYTTIGPRWASGSIQLELQMGSAGRPLDDGSADWDDVTAAALTAWNQSVSGLSFRGVRGSRAPVSSGNGLNSIVWGDDVFGEDFGDAVAVAVWRSSSNNLTEADVVFDRGLSWNSYRGNLRPAAAGGTLYDLRRVALHEFGHVLGLDHPDEQGQSVTAIMNSRTSNTDSLQADDIAGGRALYGGGSTNPAPPPSATRDRMNDGAELMPGDSLNSANRRYRLTYQSDGNLVLHDDVARVALWSTGTFGAPGFLYLHAAGNLYILDSQRRQVWSTGTSCNCDTYLVVQNDSNLVLYRADGVPLWDRIRGRIGTTPPPANVTGSFRGSIPSIGSVQFGGSPYCSYSVTLSNVTATITLGATPQGQVTTLATEAALFGCPYAPYPPHQHSYTLTSRTVTGTAVTANFAASAANAPSASLVFNGTISSDGRSISGTLTWRRIGEPPPLDWVVVSAITLYLQ